MKIATVPTGLLETNCYLVRPDDSRTLYVIDPGADARDIADRAAEFDYDRVAVLLTMRMWTISRGSGSSAGCCGRLMFTCAVRTRRSMRARKIPCRPICLPRRICRL